MNDYETKNRLIKAIAVQTGALLEHFQWGKQGSSDAEVLAEVDRLSALVDELRQTLRDS
jgi:hypothetical protein